MDGPSAVVVSAEHPQQAAPQAGDGVRAVHDGGYVILAGFSQALRQRRGRPERYAAHLEEPARSGERGRKGTRPSGWWGPKAGGECSGGTSDSCMHTMAKEWQLGIHASSNVPFALHVEMYTRRVQG